MRISVIGTGYLGATHAACLASWGHHVVGVDTDETRVRRLAAGLPAFHEPGLATLLDEGVTAGRLRFSTDPAAVRGCEAHFLCVGTPQQARGDAADLSALFRAADALAPWLGPDDLVVGKSTVPVGTARPLRGRIEATAGHPVALAWNPEFLREGRAVEDSLRPERLVFGVDDDTGERVLRHIYAPAITDGVPAVTTDLETAELAKVAANLMLAARIDLVNLLAETCEAAGAEMRDLTTILGLDSRIGPKNLVPGAGYGGGCLPKDTRAFAERAGQLGVYGARELVRQLDAINLHQRERATSAVVGLLGGRVQDATVAVLGAAFKADSDDVRESPALDVAGRLHRMGARVRVYDPRAAENVRRHAPELTVAPSVVAACQDADVVAVLTEWAEFRDLDPGALAEIVRTPRVVDGRQALDPEKWRAAGWQVRSMGSGRGR